MNPEERSVLHARLYLGAVFPTLAAMTEAIPLRTNRDWGFAVNAGRGLGAGFRVEGGRIRVAEVPGERNAFRIDFGSPERLVRAANGGTVIPRLRGGWRHPIRVVRILGLLRRMDRVLQGPVGGSGKEAYERHRVVWLLEVALRGLEVAWEHDPIARSILEGKTAGRARFRIGPSGPGRDLYWDGNAPTFGPIEEGVGANVEMIFRDEGVALAVLRHEVDSHAAIGLGNIRVIGRIPLADAIGAILDRLPL